MLMFEPRIRPCGKVIEEILTTLPCVPNRLDVATRLADLDPSAAWRPKELTGVTIEPSRPWDGSRFVIEEIPEAQELGLQMVSPNTSVFATVQLAVPAFDYLKDKLQAVLQDDGRTGRILLACGFPTGDIAIPRPRPVQRDERLPNPVAIYRKTPRVWFEIVSVRRTGAGLGTSADGKPGALDGGRGLKARPGGSASAAMSSPRFAKQGDELAPFQLI